MPIYIWALRSSIRHNIQFLTDFTWYESLLFKILCYSSSLTYSSRACAEPRSYSTCLAPSNFFALHSIKIFSLVKVSSLSCHHDNVFDFNFMGYARSPISKSAIVFFCSMATHDYQHQRVRSSFFVQPVFIFFYWVWEFFWTSSSILFRDLSKPVYFLSDRYFFLFTNFALCQYPPSFKWKRYVSFGVHLDYSKGSMSISLNKRDTIGFKVSWLF